MEFNLTTPALLFPAISLLLLAYTNRFLALASLARDLKDRWERNPRAGIHSQIANLRKRIRIIKLMQLLGATSFLLCVLTMLAIFIGALVAAELVFGLALLFLLISLAFSLRELFISADALDIVLELNPGAGLGTVSVKKESGNTAPQTAYNRVADTSLYVQVSIHKPRSGYEPALIDSMHRYGDAARSSPGNIQVHTLKDDSTGTLVGLAIWRDEASKLAANPALQAAVAGDDFALLEAEPIQGYSLREA
jgi:hypothetical protein